MEQSCWQFLYCTPSYTAIMFKKLVKISVFLSEDLHIHLSFEIIKYITIFVEEQQYISFKGGGLGAQEAGNSLNMVQVLGVGNGSRHSGNFSGQATVWF